MNALTRSVAKTLPRVQGARFMSTEHAFLKARMNPPTFKKTWLSDPTTYPIMGVVAFACSVCFSYATYKLVASPDVRISPARKNSPVRLD